MVGNMTDLKFLQIETTNLCNSHCKFCVHDKVTELGVMSDELFAKILNDVKEMPTIKRIIPFLTGEPFTDKKIIDKMKMINKMFPDMELGLYTNGSLLNANRIKQLATIKNLVVNFSLNGVNKETRENVTGLKDYNRVCKRIRLYESLEKPFLVSMVMYPTVTEEDSKSFSKIWGNHAIKIKYENFLNEKYLGNGVDSCYRAMHHMTVTWNGLVNLCCFDVMNNKIFGNLTHQSIKEVWNSAERQKFATEHLKRNGDMLYPCSICSQIEL
jgi:radical SAM protein with 4Fe4S-binding SPASM domain